MLRVAYLIAAFLTASTSGAFANTGGGFDVMSLLPIVLIFCVFYFLLLRPQQKKAKAHQELLANLRRGDKVITSGGIIGVVQKTGDTEVIIDVDDNVRLTVVKSMILEVVNHPSKAGSNTSSTKNDNVTPIQRDGTRKKQLSQKTKKALPSSSTDNKDK